MTLEQVIAGLEHLRKTLPADTPVGVLRWGGKHLHETHFHGIHTIMEEHGRVELTFMDKGVKVESIVGKG
jgi:hypothetical protein